MARGGRQVLTALVNLLAVEDRAALGYPGVPLGADRLANPFQLHALVSLDAHQVARDIDPRPGGGQLRRGAGDIRLARLLGIAEPRPAQSDEISVGRVLGGKLGRGVEILHRLGVLTAEEEVDPLAVPGDSGGIIGRAKGSRRKEEDRREDHADRLSHNELS